MPIKTQECAAKLKKEIAKIFVGKTQQVELITMSVFAGGHVLLDDLPGSGKTTLTNLIRDPDNYFFEGKITTSSFYILFRFRLS